MLVRNYIKIYRGRRPYIYYFFLTNRTNVCKILLGDKMERKILHIDVNNAFLSWTALEYLQNGHDIDIRTIASAIGGDEERRAGIILAKSTPAKKYGIQTGEPLFQALEKCPDLVVIPPDYELYVEASRHFVQMLRQFSPKVEQYSIDEAWVDMTGTQRIYGDPRVAAEKLRERIWQELQNANVCSISILV